MAYARIILFYIFGIITILIISVLPDYVLSLGRPEANGLFNQIVSFIQSFLNPDNWLYDVEGSSGEFSIFGVLWEPYLNSARILLGALLLGISLAFVLVFVVLFLPKRIRFIIKRALDFLESIPDLVFATLLQTIVIYIFKTTGVHLMPIASYMEDEAVLAPVLTLAVLPMIMLFKHLLLSVEEEFLKDYVVFLKSKGISELGILTRHVLKNVMPNAFYTIKLIIWTTLSSQFIIERVFNVSGLTDQMLDSFTPMTIAFSLILIFTPFYFFFQLMDLWLKDDQVDAASFTFPKRMFSFRGAGKNMGVLLLRLIQKAPERLVESIKSVFRVIAVHMKNWKFALGMAFFIVVIGYSFIYSQVTDNHVNQALVLYEDDGVTISSSTPHSPTEAFLLGSDELGFSIFDKMVIGAKYTLLFGLLIAFLRVAGGLLGGVLFSFGLKPGWQNSLEKLTDSIHFLPLSLVAYVILQPVLMSQPGGEFAFSFPERIVLEIIVLTVLVVPLTTVVTGRDINGVLRREFIAGSRVLGGSRFHIFWKHVLPHIGPRLAVLFGQQFIQVLLTFIHLGVFNLYFGGTIIPMLRGGDPPTSFTYEWSGMIGNVARGAISSGHYWYLFPLAAFVLSIFAMQFMIQGVTEVQQVKVGVMFKHKHHKKNREELNTQGKLQSPPKEKFKLIRRL